MHMPLARFRKIIDNVPPLSGIVAHGLGEPTLNKALPDMIGYASASGKAPSITFSTTGMAKDFNIYRRCFENGLSYLRVSVDSLDPETAQICRKNTDLNLIRKNLALLAENNYPTQVFMTVSAMNIHDIENTLGKLDEIGPFEVHAMIYLDKGESSGNLDPLSEELAVSKFKGMQDKTKNLKITNACNTAKTNYEICGSVIDITVDVGGYLTPCCHVYDRSALGYLSIEKHSYEELKNGPVMRKFMHDYVENAPDFCGGCAYNNRPTKNHGYPGRRSFLEQ